MHTPNLTRWLIRLLFSFAALCLLIASSVYLLDVNQHSDWINAKLKQTTGYDIRFQQVESSWLTDKQLSLIGVSLYQHQRPVVRIDRIDIKVDKLDLWKRQLEIGNITLAGVFIDVDAQSTTSKVMLNNDQQTPQPVVRANPLAWERLHVNQLTIIALNASIKKAEQRILIQEMNLESHDLLIIDNKKLQTLPLNLHVETQLKSLQLNNAQQSAQIDNVRLFVRGDLLRRQADLQLNIGLLDLSATQQSAFELQSLQLLLQVNRNQIHVENLSAQVFNGSVALQADSTVELTVFPQPNISISKINIQSLQGKDLQLTIPDWQVSQASVAQTSAQQLLPIGELSLKKSQLENIDINSVNARFPVTVNQLDMQLGELTLIKGNRWLSLSQYTQQATSFSFAFDYLNWQGTVLEQVASMGSLSEDQQFLQLFNQQ